MGSRLTTAQTRLLARCVFAAALVIHLFFVVTFFTDIPESIFPEAAMGKGRAADFFGIYQSGENLVNGQNIYSQDLPENLDHRVVPYYYYYRYLPPVAALSAIGSRLLAPWPAYRAWVAFNELLLLVTVLWILRWNKWPIHRRLFSAALWLGYFPLYIEQYMGQFSLAMAIFLLLLWKIAVSAVDSRRVSPHPGDGPPHPSNRSPKRSWLSFAGGPSRFYSSIASIVWSASILLKTFPIMFVVPYFRDKSYKRIVASFSTVTLLSAPYFFLYPDTIRDFIRLNLNPFVSLYRGDFGFQAFLKILCRTFFPVTDEGPLGVLGSFNSPERIILAACTILIIILAIHVSFKLRSFPDRQAFDLMLWTTVFFLIYKTIWEYHYLMMLPAITAIVLCRGTPIVYIMGILIGMPTLFGLLPSMGIDPSASIDHWPVFVRIGYFGSKAIPVLVLYLWTLSTVYRTTRTGPDRKNIYHQR
ncbi:MAG: hypothetical protein KAV42_01635 [Candidatus Krumholzibacteria bacterium]|nr:hypothetical protein [Candidatus Krumholzibacteria bacterium]